MHSRKSPNPADNQKSSDFFSSESNGLSLQPPQFKLEASAINKKDQVIQNQENTNGEKEKEAFKVGLGTKKTEIDGTYGKFEANHGLTKQPSSTDFGEYSFKLEMDPNDKAGESEIGFIQTVRQGKADGTPATKEGEMFLTKGEVDRQEDQDGWMIDRANPKRDKTPFYGMYKDSKGAIKQYSTSSVGKHGTSKAMLSDTPAVADPDHMRFVSTATDMKKGTKFGAVEWGYEFDSSNKKYEEVQPKLVDNGDAKLEARDRAYTKWNDVVADENIDKTPSEK